MSNYDFGNYNRDKDYSLYQLVIQKKVATEKTVEAKEKVNINYEMKSADADSLNALGVYGMAFSGLGKKTDVSGLNLSANDQALVSRYVTPEQQARISEDVLKYFG